MNETESTAAVEAVDERERWVASVKRHRAKVENWDEVCGEAFDAILRDMEPDQPNDEARLIAESDAAAERIGGLRPK